MERRLKEYLNSRRLTLDQVAPVLLDLHRGESQPEYRQDPRFGGQKAPSVRLGWVSDQAGGKDMTTVGVLMSRDELGRLIDELEVFQQAAERGQGLD